MRGLGLLLLLLLPLGGAAQEGGVQVIEGRGTLKLAFTPGDDADVMILQAIRGARNSIRVQAYSFTHARIAAALIAARRRGVDVQVIADLEQSYAIATTVIPDLVREGVPVWLDGEHAAAHDKAMIIDPEDEAPSVITGSYNFTHAAQYRNAENVLLLRGNRELAQAYLRNWESHRRHARAWTASPPPELRLPRGPR